MAKRIEYQEIENKLKRLPMTRSRKLLLDNRLKEVEDHQKKYGNSYHEVKDEHVLPSKKNALMNMKSIDGIKTDIKKCDEIINIFESAFDKLDPMTNKVIDMRYLKSMSWEDVGYEVGYCIRSCNRIADAGLRQIEEMIGDVYED
ncbi:MAG: hypothetical protein JEZ08_24880 [Clostridiales bacterium]|nr:hypothetical protein [Clostridiales bacterium]